MQCKKRKRSCLYYSSFDPSEPITMFGREKRSSSPPLCFNLESNPNEDYHSSLRGPTSPLAGTSPFACQRWSGSLVALRIFLCCFLYAQSLIICRVHLVPGAQRRITAVKRRPIHLFVVLLGTKYNLTLWSDINIRIFRIEIEKVTSATVNGAI
ncbi:hypothetical protein JOM56_008140 [Amanita muscaria]